MGSRARINDEEQWAGGGYPAAGVGLHRCHKAFRLGLPPEARSDVLARGTRPEINEEIDRHFECESDLGGPAWFRY